MYLAPILHSGLAGSDVYLAHLRAMEVTDGISAPAAVRQSLMRLSSVDGGISPLRAFPIVLWFVTTSLTVAKIVQYALILANMATFALLARKLLGSNGSALLATAMTLTVWQLRYPHDPALGSSYQWPWLAELVLVATYGVLKFADAAEIRWLFLAVFAAIAAGFSSPNAWPIVALLGIASTTLTASRLRFAACTAFLAVAAVLAATSSDSLRSPQLAPWTRPNYAYAVGGQLLAALPTTYRAFGNIARDGITDNSLGDTRFTNIPDIELMGWLAILAISVGAYVGLAEAERHRSTCGAVAIATFAAALWLGPAIALGPNRYWPHGMPLGQSFEAVYLEQFGAGLLGAWLLIRFGKSGSTDRRRTTALAMTLVVLLVGFGNVRANAFAIRQVGAHDRTRSLVERSGADGFFAAIPAGSTILLPGDSGLYDTVYGDPSDAKNAIYHYTGRIYTTRARNANRPGGPLCRSTAKHDCKPTDSAIFILRAVAPHLVEPQLSLVRWSATRDGVELSDVGHGFAAFPNAAAADSAAQLLNSIQPGVREDVAANIEPGALAYTATRTCGPVPAALLFAPAISTISWGAGFYPAPAVGQMPYYAAGSAPLRRNVPIFRWAASKAVLVVHRSTCAPKPVAISFTILTGQPGAITIRWDGGSLIFRGSRAPLAVNFTVGQNVASPIKIDIATQAKPFAEEVMLVRKEGEAPQDHRMLVSSPTVKDVLENEMNPELNPDGGLL